MKLKKSIKHKPCLKTPVQIPENLSKKSLKEFYAHTQKVGHKPQK